MIDLLEKKYAVKRRARKMLKIPNTDTMQILFGIFSNSTNNTTNYIVFATAVNIGKTDRDGNESFMNGLLDKMDNGNVIPVNSSKGK